MCHEQKCHGICFTQRHTAVQLTVYRLSSIVYLLLNVVGGRLPFLITISLHACICPFVKSKKSFCNTTVHNDTVPPPLFSCLYYLTAHPRGQFLKIISGMGLSVICCHPLHRIPRKTFFKDKTLRQRLLL